MSCLNKSWVGDKNLRFLSPLAKTGLCGFVLFGAFACTTPKYAYHAVFKLTGCGRTLSREEVARALVRKGYLKSSEIHGPYDVFHEPKIVEKGVMAQEPYEDKAGDMAVAVCAGGSENYIVTEEWTHCQGQKDCTVENQRDLRKLAEEWGCQVSERSSHSLSWKLEDRQDWTKDSCSLITTQLTL